MHVTGSESFKPIKSHEQDFSKKYSTSPFNDENKNE
jgi:hypothetical protein